MDKTDYTGIMTEYLNYEPLSETISGALLLAKMNQLLSTYQEIASETDTSSSETINSSYTGWLLHQIITSATEKGIQYKTYTTICPVEELIDNEFVPLWDCILQMYLGTFERFANVIDFNQASGEVIIDNSKLVHMVRYAYKNINCELDTDVDSRASLIATINNDRRAPPSYRVDAMEEDDVITQENIYVVEAFLCDVLGLPRKENIETPVGFGRLPKIISKNR